MIALPFDPSEREPLAPYTSLQLGGPAEFFVRAASEEVIAGGLAWAEARGVPVTLLGGGSNVVVADRGVPGLVLTVAVLGQSVVRQADQIDVSVGAGESWDPFVAACVNRGWAGIECLSGIPGHVGATPIQNVGAYGQEVSDSLLRVAVYDRTSRRAVELSHGQCGFGYRTSRFKGADAERFVVLGATFRLREGGAAGLRYPEIAQRFGPGGPEPSLRDVREAVVATRRSKSMLLEPGENARSCGSFFLNPLLTSAELERLVARRAAPPPAFPQPDGRIKVPAAWLIEQAGFRRGQRWGSVGISSRHSLALVCHEGATALQLLEAAHRVRDGVARELEIWLSPEPRFLGFESSGDGLPPLG